VLPTENKLKGIIMRAILLSLMFCFLFTLPANAGPVAPNETTVKGRVVKYGVIS
jgi:hypothetical protein